MGRIDSAILSVWLSIATWPSSAVGAVEADPRSGLSTEQQRLVDGLLASQHPYECCRDTIATCLQQAPVCALARRLERAICRMAATGMPRAEIERALVQRKQSMAFLGQKGRIELNPRFSAGEPSSPIVLVLYACGRSERCAELIPSLYNEVGAGRLKGKVRLYYRPWSQDDNDAAACGRALVAAADQGMFWPYILRLYSQREHFQQCMLRKWADLEGLDRDAFEIAYDHPRTTALLAAPRQEGVENKVDSVPSAFINGRKVRCELSVDTLLDLLEEEHDRKGG